MAMRGPSMVSHRAWDSLGNGALFTTRIRGPAIPPSRFKPATQPSGQPPGIAAQCRYLSHLSQPSRPAVRATTSSRLSQFSANIPQRRVLRTSPILREVQSDQKNAATKKPSDPADDDDADLQVFGRSEKAQQAAQLNLSAKLSSAEGDGKKGGGWKEIARLLRIARPELGTLSWAFLFLLISSGITMSVPFSIGRILDAATKEGDTLFGLPMQTFYIALGALLATGAVANYGRILLLRIVGERVVTKLRSQLFKRTFVQNAEFFDANRVGDLISRLGSDTIIVGKSITQNLSDGLRSLVSAAAGLTMMGYTSLSLTGILAVMFPPVAFGAFFYGRAIRNLSRRIQKNLGTLTKIAEERLGNVRTSQAFVGELQEVRRYNEQVRKIFFLGKRDAFISATFFSFSGFAGNMTFLALLYAGSSMVKSGAISVGDLTSFLMYTAYAGGSLFGLSGFYSELMKGVGAASRLFELQDRNPTISPTIGDMVQSARGNINFKDVSFAYPTRPAVEIFKDLSFTIPEGSNVAIVAPSGAGKSTVASLLLRFYTPRTGTITIGGKDITTMNAKQLRRRIGYVGQEPVLFSGTIAENIAYGKPLASRSEIVKAAREANCQFVSDFPEGLETFVGARGTQLSGGQKQRIAIARALLKDPDILILDEATSALDAESETLVNQALGRLLRSHNTTISIAHRLSTIQRSDRIICIGTDGKVAQIGTYRELSEDKEGSFAKLMEWQMSGGQSTKRDEPDPTLTEEELRLQRLEEREMDAGKDAAAAEQVGEGSAVRKDDETAAEAVVERTK